MEKVNGLIQVIVLGHGPHIPHKHFANYRNDTLFAKNFISNILDELNLRFAFVVDNLCTFDTVVWEKFNVGNFHVKKFHVKYFHLLT